ASSSSHRLLIAALLRSLGHLLAFGVQGDAVDVRVNAGQEPLLFAGEVAVLMRGGLSPTALAGPAWF
ncbi:MAG: hypothetical protein MUF08_10525, partial [Burkholderiaceae bacterium]|nr:hypothetical protein [Burkholderiaceae bacterium]